MRCRGQRTWTCSPSIALLEELAVQDREQARIVELRYFGGLTFEEIAAVLGTSASAAKRAWSSARLWLHWRLRSAEP